MANEIVFGWCWTWRFLVRHRNISHLPTWRPLTQINIVRIQIIIYRIFHIFTPTHSYSHYTFKFKGENYIKVELNAS